MAMSSGTLQGCPTICGVAKYEWVRTALAIDRAGSITGGAEARNISQPAASQQLQSLEAALGEQIFERHRMGVRATATGARFLREVSGPFEQIAWLLDGLDAGAVQPANPPVVVGCSPEWFAGTFLPTVTPTVPLRARFGTDDELLDDLRAGRVDLAVTSRRPASRAVDVRAIGDRSYQLVVGNELKPARELTNLAELDGWIRSTPWVGYSEEMPLTRRFWQEVTGSLQPTNVALVAGDLRVVARAVENGLGASLLPANLCRGAIASGRLVSVPLLTPVGVQQTDFLSVSAAARQRPEVRALADLIWQCGERLEA